MRRGASDPVKGIFLILMGLAAMRFVLMHSPNLLSTWVDPVARLSPDFWVFNEPAYSIGLLGAGAGVLAGVWLGARALLRNAGP